MRIETILQSGGPDTPIDMAMHILDSHSRIIPISHLEDCIKVCIINAVLLDILTAKTTFRQWSAQHMSISPVLLSSCLSVSRRLQICISLTLLK